MKKILSTILCFAGVATAFSQNISDALRYSIDDMNGTARFKAMSGAFGALGGDLSAININPAGSSVFSASEFSVTLGNQRQESISEYFGTKQTKTDNDFDISQLGAVFSLPVDDNSTNWKKISFGFNYQRTRSFDGKDFAFNGVSDKNLGDYFLYHANGKTLSELEVNSAKKETVESV